MYLIAVSTTRKALNKPFMPDYDPKIIPILDDVIENADNKKRDFDLSVEPPDDEARENNLDLFASEDIDLAAEDADIESAATETSIIEVETAIITDSNIEYSINPGAISPATGPQIGPVDNISNDDGDDIPLYSPAKASEDEAEKFESALIDYNAVDEAVASTIDMPVIDMPATNKQEEDQPLEVNQQTSTAISLQSVTDDIVKQLMPELEQQLRLLLEQALKEKLPEDIKQTEIPSASNPDN
jgi:hypothetical protein